MMNPIRKNRKKEPKKQTNPWNLCFVEIFPEVDESERNCLEREIYWDVHDI